MRPSTTRPRGFRKGLSIKGETEQLLNTLSPLVEAIARTFGPHLEVVLHDLRIPERSIVAIENGHVTGRRVGGPVIGGSIDDKALRLLHEGGSGPRALVNYPTRTRDGRDLKSTSIVYYSQITGESIVALCLNYDLTEFQGARAALEAFVRRDNLYPAGSKDGEASVPRADLERTIQMMIDQVIESLGKPVSLMDSEGKSAIVAALDEAGLFIIRGAAQRVAQALGVSRFTVYNYLKKIRNRN